MPIAMAMGCLYTVCIFDRKFMCVQFDVNCTYVA